MSGVSPNEGSLPSSAVCQKPVAAVNDESPSNAITACSSPVTHADPTAAVGAPSQGALSPQNSKPSPEAHPEMPLDSSTAASPTTKPTIDAGPSSTILNPAKSGRRESSHLSAVTFDASSKPSAESVQDNEGSVNASEGLSLGSSSTGPGLPTESLSLTQSDAKTSRQMGRLTSLSRIPATLGGTEGTAGAARAATKEFQPAAVLDGSKLILRLGKNGRFLMESPCLIMLNTPNIKVERLGTRQTTVTCTEKENTIVIDTGAAGLRFVPIPLAHYGTIYTKDGVVHVIVGIGVKRTKVQSRNLPYKTCNKLCVMAMLDSDDSGEDGVEGRPVLTDRKFAQRQSTSRALGEIDPKQAMRIIKQLASDPSSGVVYIRADDSIIRYKLRHDERIELHACQVIAWTLGVRFEQTSHCCFRCVSAVYGEGTVWIQHNAKPRGATTGYNM